MMGDFYPCTAAPRQAPGVRWITGLALALGVLLTLLVLFAGCGDEQPLEPEGNPPPTLERPGDPPEDPPEEPPEPPTGPPTHRLMIALEMPHFEDPDSLAALLEGFDAFKYGHQGRYEEEVRELQASGTEDWRYFNVFHTSPNYPRWGAYYTDLHAFLDSIDGWIKGAGYRWFSDPADPDRIIDHTRAEVSAGVARIISAWADSTAASHVFLDLTFDQISDWMLMEGTSWPWPPEEHQARNVLWRRNMQSLIDAVAANHPIMINGSVRLRAPSVLYENQVWNARRGWSPWEGLLERIVSREIVPGLHVGHHFLGPTDIIRGEALVLAVALLADESYLLVEPEGRPLAWAREIQDQGFQYFEPTGPASEVASGIWRREGMIGNQRWFTEVNLTLMLGRVVRGSP